MIDESQATTTVLFPPALDAPVSASSHVRVDIAAETHTGHRRPTNEDHYIVGRVGRSFTTLMTNIVGDDLPDALKEVGYGFLVADGMGGKAAGEVASRMAITQFVEIILNVPDWILQIDDRRGAEVMRRAEKYYQQVGAALTEKSQQQPELAGMGTTMTMAYSLGDNLFLAHVGDSRAYLFRNGELQQLTRDHTLATVLVESGQISPEEATSHRLRHVLTNFLGGDDRNLKVELHRLRVRDGDRLLLCSDGLTEMVADPDIADILATQQSSDRACDRLLNRALENGGHDNITVIVAGYEIPEPSLPHAV